MTGREDVYQQSMNQGHSEAWDQNWDKASEFYRKAVEEKPDSSQAITSLGLALFELQKFDESQVCYLQAAKILPDDPLPIERLAEIYERTGRVKEAADQSMKAADMYLRIKDADKAIENWTRVTRLDPEHLKAHSRLAVVFERMGRKDQAIREYISVASLLQDVGQIEEAVQAVAHASQIDPNNQEAHQAYELVKANKTLPKPRRPRGGTGPLRMAAVRESEHIPDVEIPQEGPDPIGEAKQKALTALAGLLFEVSADDLEDDSSASKGLDGVFSNQGEMNLTKISIHLGAAIDNQTKSRNEAAAEELKHAIDSGLNFPAAFYDLGYLYFNEDRMESAIRNLQRSVKHPDYAVAARLMVADYNRKRGRLNDAVVEYLEALKEADSSLMSVELSDVLREQYEPIIESMSQEEDEAKLDQLCKNVRGMLMRPNWRKHLSETRQQLPPATSGSLPIPIADMLTEAENSEIVESMSFINQMARDGFLRTAMEEAYRLIDKAPTYLPLHIQMGELLLRENRTKQAIIKFTIVSQTYASRGEAKRATNLLRRIVDISPMDLGARNRLINRLTEQGQVNQAISEYISLGDVQYRLAQLDNARGTYENALRLAQQTKADQSWSVQILKHMADIDMQRLDWRQALVVYEQLRTLVPEDFDTRIHLIELNSNLGQSTQAAAELDNFLSYLSGIAKDSEALPFLEKMVEENPEMVFVHQRLAEYYQQANRPKDAIAQWDKVAEVMVEKGETEAAKEAIRAILIMNPSNAEQYRLLLQKLD